MLNNNKEKSLSNSNKLSSFFKKLIDNIWLIAVIIAVVLPITFLVIKVINEKVSSNWICPRVESIEGVFYFDNEPDYPHFIVLTGNQNDTHTLMFVDSKLRKTIWWSEKLNYDQGDETAWAINSMSNTFYFSDKNYLKAFRISDGKLLWEATLSDVCDNNLLLNTGAIIALTIDGRLQAFDQENGQPLWKYIIGYGQDMKILNISNTVLYFNPYQDSDPLWKIDPLTGKYVSSIAPKFNSQEYIISYPEFIDSDNGWGYFFIQPEGPIQCWDLLNNEMKWTSDPNISLDWDYSEAKMTGNSNHLFLGGHKIIYHIDLLYGTIDKIAEEFEFNLTPVAWLDENLVVHSKKLSGSTRNELWRINKETGNIIWQVNPTNKYDDLNWISAYSVGEKVIGELSYDYGEKFVILSYNPETGEMIDDMTFHLDWMDSPIVHIKNNRFIVMVFYRYRIVIVDSKKYEEMICSWPKSQINLN